MIREQLKELIMRGLVYVRAESGGKHGHFLDFSATVVPQRPDEYVPDSDVPPLDAFDARAEDITHP